jgi:hypothetical protein
MTSPRRRLIWFCSTEAVAQHPEWLAQLRDRIGLTTIMPESSVCHTSGFAASRELAAAGPFEDWRSRVLAWPQARDGIYPPVAGIVSGFDDTPLVKVLEACARAGIEVWGHLGLYSYGGEVYPEYAMVDLEGKPLDRRYQRWGIGLCPSRPAVNQWVRDGLVEAARRYGLTGFCVDHARYPAPANLHALLGCGCADCEAAAQALGYDLAALRLGMRRWQAGLARLTLARLKELERACPGPVEVLAWLGEDRVVLDWLLCRAGQLATRMTEFRQAVRGLCGDSAVFGSDVFPPSAALLGGHHYPSWEQATDFLTGGSSHGGVVGWATVVPNLAEEWAAALGRRVTGLVEDEAVALLWKVFGYGDLLTAPGAGVPVAAIYEREVARLKAATSGAVPLYPPVATAGPVELVRPLLAAVRDHECDGAMLTLDPGNTATLDLIAEYLA